MKKFKEIPDSFVISEENFLANIERSMVQVSNTCCGMFVILPDFFGELKKADVFVPLKNGLKSAVFAKVTEKYKDVSGNKNISDSGVCALAITLGESAAVFLDNTIDLFRIRHMEVPTLFMMIRSSADPAKFNLELQLHDTVNGMSEDRPPIADQSFGLTIRKDIPMSLVLSSLISGSS